MENNQLAVAETHQVKNENGIITIEGEVRETGHQDHVAGTTPDANAVRVAQEMVKMFSRFEREGVMFDHELGINSNNRNLTFTKTLKRYDTEMVDKWLEQPSRYTKELRDLSLFLSQSNTIYFRTIQYMSSMAQICPVVIPNHMNPNVVQARQDYLEVATLLDKLSLPHEMIKVFVSVFTEAVFFGLEYETDNSFYIKKLNPDYCRITTTVDGAYCYHFNLAFFNRDNTLELLKSYAEIWEGFIPAYAKYKKDASKQWVELPADKTICIKMNEASEHSIPPFVSVFGDLCHLADYKNLNKISVEQGNYQLLALELETSSKTEKENAFTVSTDVAMAFYNMIASNLPAGVGAFLTPVGAKPIKFDKKTSDANQVANATSALYDSLGISPILFSAANNSGALKYSIKVDEGLVFNIYRQIERWLNRKLKILDYDFHVKLLDITTFNRGDVQAELLKMAQMSIPVKAHLAASAGLSPLDMLNTSYLEYAILEVDDKWKPLASSHTQTKEEKSAGREAKDETELSEKGQATRDSSSNDNREEAI